MLKTENQADRKRIINKEYSVKEMEKGTDVKRDRSSNDKQFK